MADLKEYEVWMEGFAATGESGTAQLIGRVKAESFQEACKKLCLTTLDRYQNGLIKSDAHGCFSIWGCRLFDNEVDARKTFG